VCVCVCVFVFAINKCIHTKTHKRLADYIYIYTHTHIHTHTQTHMYIYRYRYIYREIPCKLEHRLWTDEIRALRDPVSAM
jgi:hypothetical protein